MQGLMKLCYKILSWTVLQIKQMSQSIVEYICKRFITININYLFLFIFSLTEKDDEKTTKKQQKIGEWEWLIPKLKLLERELFVFAKFFFNYFRMETKMLVYGWHIRSSIIHIFNVSLFKWRRNSAFFWAQKTKYYKENFSLLDQCDTKYVSNDFNNHK